MRLFHFAAIMCLVGCCATSAWAQYGLYGSPEVLRVSQVTPASASDGYNVPTTTYPGIAIPATQTAPPSQAYYQPQPQVQPQPQPQYQYQARTSVMPNYQPIAQQYQQSQQPQPIAQQYQQSQQYQPVAQQYQQSQQYQPVAQQYQQSQQYQPAPQQYRSSTPYTRPTVQTTAMYQPSAQAIPMPPAAPEAQAGPTTAPSLIPQPTNAMLPQGPNGVNPMPSEPGYYGNNGCYGCNNGYNGACRGDACGYDAGFDNNCCPWYGSLSTIVLGRSEGKRLWTSFTDRVNVDQLTNTQDIHLPWAWGGEIQFGRRFGCGCDTWALEATYWATQSMDGYRSTTNPQPDYLVSTPLEVTDLHFNGETADDWFEGAEEHRLWRRDQFQDIEINLIRQQTSCGCNSPWNVGWSLGVRYFRFDENLTFGTLRDGGTWGQLANEAYLNDNIANNLVGFQLGFDASYNYYNNVRFFISPKIGVYNNNMTQYFQAYLGNGTVGTTPYGPFPVSATRNDIAFLSQVDLGMDWQFSRNWSARVGYRVIAMTGIAEADDQFPQYIVDLPEIAHIDNHSSLVLHGAFAGLTYNF